MKTHDVSILARLGLAGARCKLSMMGLGQSLPYWLILNLTFRCNSRCKTCDIWKTYLKHPEGIDEEMSVDEVARIVKILPGLLRLTIGGGEVFLRPDLSEVIEAVLKHSRRISVIDMSTNGLQPDVTEGTIRKVLALFPDVYFDVSVSLDGPRHVHDQVRGIEGNWDKAVDTIKRLRKIGTEFRNFGTHINHTVSVHTAGNLRSILQELGEEGVRACGDDVSLSIARGGAAFLKTGDHSMEVIGEDMRVLAYRDIDDLLESSSGMKGITLQGLRPLQKKIYHRLAKRYLQNPNKQVIPCAALSGSCYVDPYGNVFPCTIWGEAKLGNLRDVDYDLKKILSSSKTKGIRAKIREGTCSPCWTGCESSISIIENIVELLPRLALGKL